MADTFIKPNIPVPAWGDEFPNLLKISVVGQAEGLPTAAYSTDSLFFIVTPDATVACEGLVTGATVTATKSTELSTEDYDYYTLTMPSEGIEITIEEPEEE